MSKLGLVSQWLQMMRKEDKVNEGEVSNRRDQKNFIKPT